MGDIVEQLNAEIVRTVDLDMIHHTAANEITTLRQQLAEREKELAEAREAAKHWEDTCHAQWESNRATSLAIKSLAEVRAALEDMHGQFSQQNISKAGLLDWMKHAIALATTDLEAIIRQHDAEVWERAAEICVEFGKTLEVDIGDCFAEELRAEAEKLK